MDKTPLFDSVSRALDFAFNVKHGALVPPVMNRAMADTPAKKKKKQDGNWDRVASRSHLQPGESLRGMSRIGQAGMILQLVARLNIEQQYALRARFIRPDSPCACGSPCCQGHRVNLAWKQAVDGLCEYLKSDAYVVRRSRSKLGLSTEPRLRLAIVTGHFLSKLHPQAQIAAEVGVSATTVAKHSELIGKCLEVLEDSALEEIALIFDQVGLVGFVP